MQIPAELDELRISLERIRTLLETLVIRGLRACGPDELSQIGVFAEQLSQSGAGHLASLLFGLRTQIERDEPLCAQTLLETQTNVRLLERLLTLRVVRWRFDTALELSKREDGAVAADGAVDDDGDEEE
jgi:hypothetical protein